MEELDEMKESFENQSMEKLNQLKEIILHVHTGDWLVRS